MVCKCQVTAQSVNAGVWVVSVTHEDRQHYCFIHWRAVLGLAIMEGWTCDIEEGLFSVTAKLRKVFIGGPVTMKVKVGRFSG